MLSVICDSGSRGSQARLTNQKAREISSSKYPNPGRVKRISRRRGARWRSRSHRVEETETVEKESSFGGGRGGKGGASGNAELPLSTSGVDRKWRGARSAHNSAYYDTSCESSRLEQSIGIYIYATRRSL